MEYYLLVEHRWPVTATLSDSGVTSGDKHYFELNPEQWVLPEELVKVLQPFQCATVTSVGGIILQLHVFHS